MIEFIGLEQNWPFTTALMIMLGITSLEVITTLMGLGLSGLLDNMLPDLDLDVDLDVDIDVDADADLDLDVAGTNLTWLSDWFCVGKVPLLIMFIVFLASFGLIGLAIQLLAKAFIGSVLSPLIGGSCAFIACLPSLRILGSILAKVLPKDETEAVSANSFIGLTATITVGTSKRNNAAEAKLVDQHGKTHYIMVEPEKDNVEYKSGTEVVIYHQEKAGLFLVTNDMLIEHNNK
jgi:hypothetical protein